MRLRDWGEPPIGDRLGARLGPALEPLGFRLVETTEDGVRSEGGEIALEARYVPRDGELALYAIPRGSDQRLQLLIYLRAIGSPAADRLGEAVAYSGQQALEHLEIYLTAIPELTRLLAGDPCRDRGSPPPPPVAGR